MTQRVLRLRLPELDGPTAFRLIGLLDALVAELWLVYGDTIYRDAGLTTPGPEEVPDRDADIPF